MIGALMPLLIFSLWTPSIFCADEKPPEKPLKRYRREPPAYHRPIKQSYGPPPRRKPKPVYGPPPRPVYGPPSKPKPVYGPPSKPVYSAPPSFSYEAPSYHPPTLSYGAPPPSYHGQGAPSSNYGAPSPSYGTPSSSYGAPSSSYGAPSSGYGPPVPSYSRPSPPSTSYGVPIHYSPPSNSYGPPSHSYGPPLSFGPPPLQPSHTYGPPSHSYGPPSSSYGAPSHFQGYESQTTSYSHSSPNYGVPEVTYHPTYEIPQRFSNHQLHYDTSSASYGTPGALNSYGIPATQHEPPLQYDHHISSYNGPHQRTEEVLSSEDVFSSLTDPYNADGSNNYVKFEDTTSSTKVVKLKAPDPTVSYGKTETSTKVPNHNYDGPGVQDESLEIFINDRKKQLEKLKNFYKTKNFENYSDDVEVQKSHSFDYYAGKSHTVSEKRAPQQHQRHH
ncbi:hypothetical protein BDFB_000848 [Asbolus verrucosus]|uniref:Uncharacterized protein n=1 Tax=Asbolus verrucosus TaxID=1661398 RepID=A0A482VM29_ASBVE|nr:hypothetical protein BDFB_000848 [Asbolus verrucosus]